ncbi:MAG: porin [Oceanobacter sp.]
MKHNRLTLAILAAMSSAATLAPTSAFAASEQDQRIEALEARIDELETLLDERLNLLADAVEQQAEPASSVHFGGYGEFNYHSLNVDGTDEKELDFRRWVLFVGYDFSDRIRFSSEFEVEHTVVPGSEGNGAIELEQAYLEFDLTDTQQLKTGIQLMPIGIMSETHEPTTYYGVERPIVETTIIPTTWFAGGVMYSQRFGNGISYDLFLSEGLKTDDPTTSSDADAFDIKSGKQKTSYADVFDLATTARIKYTGVSGLELAAYAQYQPDLDQSAETSYADRATLIGAHAVYQFGDFETRALYARWDLAGDDAAAAAKNVQEGMYLEASWTPWQEWGFFVRQSNWSVETNVNQSQLNAGFNYLPIPEVVFKADYQLQNEDAGNSDGFYLGMGYFF